MRKCILVGLAVLAVLGVGSYLLSERHRGTVEWHKREFLRPESRIEGWIVGNAPQPFVDWWITRNVFRRASHIRALKELGYLETRVYSVSNSPAQKVFDGIYGPGTSTTHTNIDRIFGSVQEIGSNTLTVVCPSDQTEVWRDLIRKLDVPEK